MSDDPERSFSAGRDMITYRCSNLYDEIIQACMCLQSWYRPLTAKKQGRGWQAAEFDDEEVVEEVYAKAQSGGSAADQPEAISSDSELSDEETANV